MNILPIFQTLQNNAEVVHAVNTRIYEDVAPHGTPFPYVVWSTITGLPENVLDGLPKIDHVRFQVVVYDTQATRASNIRKLVADTLAERCYVLSTMPNHHERVGDADIFGRGFEANWWMHRSL